MVSFIKNLKQKSLFMKTVILCLVFVFVFLINTFVQAYEKKAVSDGINSELDIQILDKISHPQQGENWEVAFIARGKADLKIIPDDIGTINDDEFVGLYCGNQTMLVELLEDDVIYFKDWECTETGKVIHYTLKAGDHTLRFEFGDQIRYAYNDASSDDPWWNASWNNRRAVTFNNATSSLNLTNFPVLVELNENTTALHTANIDYSKTKDSGEDVRFVDYDGTELDYEIEKWDETATSTVWVEVPTVEGSTSTQHFYMYYNNTGASDNSTTTGVWDDNYLGVWHLDEAYDAAADDSTREENDGTHNDFYSSTSTVTTNISKGVDFDGVGDDITLADDPSLDLDADDDLTVTFWVNFDTLDANPGDADIQSLVDKRHTNDYWFLWQRGGASNYVFFQIGDGSNSAGVSFPDSYMTPGQWHYVSATLDQDSATGMKLYYNGSLKNTANPTSVGDCSNTSRVSIGAERWQDGVSRRWLNGQMSEVRIAKTSRSVDWIAAAYESVASLSSASTTDNYISFSAAETGDPSPVIASVTDSPSLAIAGSNVTFSTDWNDPDAGENIKVKICKTDSLTNQNCDGGSWASSTVFTTSDPEETTYTTVDSMDGIFDYYAFVCDDDGNCSSSKAGSFLVRDASWWNTSWTNRRVVTFNNATSSSNLTSFPVLVELNDTTTSLHAANIDYSKTQNLGEDIRFINYDGTELDYEIESWNEAATSTIWVRTPTIEGSTSTQHFWMYYNNTEASDNSTTTGVWDENFIMVHHLQESDIDGGSNDIKDSTRNTNHGTTDGMDGSDDVDARIGSGFDLAGDDDNVYMAEPPSSETDITTGSVSAWIKTADAGSSWRGTIVKQSAYGLYLLDGDLAIYDWGTSNTRDSNINLEDSSWHHVVLAFNSGVADQTEFYIDGISRFTTSMTVNSQAQGLIIGAGDNPGTQQYFAGIIDEARVSGAARTANWFAAEYETVASLSTASTTDNYISFATEEVGTVPQVSSVTDTPSPTVAESSVTFSVDWHDPNAGENIKVKICKTDSLTNQVCDGGSWASSTVFTTSYPEAPTYTTAENMDGVFDYYTFVCDDDDNCSSSSQGSFIVRATSWWNTSWTNRRVVTFNNATSSSNLTNFPVLIELNEITTSLHVANIDYSKTKDLGEDIRFVDYDGTELDYEIEEWNESATSTVWVETPSVEGSTSTQHFYMYYNNTGASDNSSSTAVWDSGYLGVWHMATATDSTTNHNDGTPKNEVASATGRIGGAYDFEPINDYIELAAISANSYTMSAWVYMDTTGASRSIMQIGDFASGSQYDRGGMYWENEGHLRYFKGYDAGYTKYQIGETLTGKWTYLVGMYNSTGQISFFVDGRHYSSTSVTPYDLNNDIAIGAVGDGSVIEKFWDGKIDEVRFSNATRTDDWVAASYETVASLTSASTTDDYVSFAAEENSPPAVSSAADSPDPTNPNRSVTFSVDWDSGVGFIKVKVCKTDSLTNQVCNGGSWASSTVFTTDDPASVKYNVVEGDYGQTRDYYVFLCDNVGKCSSSSSGTFSVNNISTVPDVKIRGDTKIRGGTKFR
jgi:hypothetical protein